MLKVNKFFTPMNLSFFYWIPIVFFGLIYLIKLSKNIFNDPLNQGK